MMRPNHALEPTPVGRFSSAFAVDIIGPAWLNLSRSARALRAILTPMNKNIPPLLALLLFVASTGGASAGINYRSFSSPTGLIFQGDTTLQGDFVRLTPSDTNLIGRVGGLWFQTKQPVRDGFETTFQFRITDKVRHGGDGFAF